MSLPDKLPDQSWRAVVELARAEEVEAYLIDEIFKALGIRADSRWRSWFGHIFLPIVRGFIRQAVAFDQSVARHGFRASAQEWLNKWITGLQVVGKEQLPSEGPLLIAANHPGTYDGLAIAATVPRQDLRIVTAANPFFRTLPNAREHFIYATRDVHVRVATLRNALRHLQSGGALLIFPSGKLEPDPLHFKHAARQALSRWSASLKLFLSKVPQTLLVVAMNAGFVDQEFLQHPLARLMKTDENRQKLAEFIQVIQQIVFNRRIPSRPHVFFSEPMSFSQLKDNTSDIHEEIILTASRLLERIPSSGIG